MVFDGNGGGLADVGTDADQAVVEDQEVAEVQVEGSRRWTPEGWLRLSVGVLKRIVPTDPEYPERVNGDLGARRPMIMRH